MFSRPRSSPDLSLYTPDGLLFPEGVIAVAPTGSSRIALQVDGVVGSEAELLVEGCGLSLLFRKRAIRAVQSPGGACDLIGLARDFKIFPAMAVTRSAPTGGRVSIDRGRGSVVCFASSGC